MSRHPVTLPPSDTLQQALAAMDQAHISSIVATKDQQAQGIISERDLVQLALEQDHLHRICLRDVMHAQVLTLPAGWDTSAGDT